MRNRVIKTSLLLLICFLITACDKGKKPYEKAEQAFAESNYDVAKVNVLEVIQKAPQSEYLARAKEIYEKIKNLEVSLKVAQEATQRGDLEKAIKAYKDTLTLDSKCPEAITALPKLKEDYERKSKLLRDVKAFKESGDWEKAIEAYKTIVTFVPTDKNANLALKHIEEYDYPVCCREEINKYKPRHQLLGSIQLIFSQTASGDNEFELKKDKERIRKEEDEISRKTVFFDIIDSLHNVRLSEYDFRKQEYKVRFGVQRGTSDGERFGIASSPDVLQIANDKGNRMEFTLKMKEAEAESLDKENLKLFVVYKFIKGERFRYWSPLAAQARQSWGGDGYEEDTRIYIKPLNVILLSGDSKYTLYEAEDKN